MRSRPSQVVVHGVRVDLDPSWPEEILTAMYMGSYEALEANVIRRTLTADDRYFEMGASIGVMMTIACGLVGDQNVTAVEANPELIAQAVYTASANGYRPTVINALLGVGDGPQDFYIRNFWESSTISHPDARHVKVPGGSFIAALEETGATYLNVDIEGGEIALLEPPLPASVRALCMEVHPDLVGPGRVQVLLRHLMDQGFTLDTHLLAPQVVYMSRASA